MNEHEDIVHLKGLEAVQKRPGMYVGSTENCDVLFREVLDNSIDEAFTSKDCNKIDINKNKSGYYIIKDNGRGIPTRPSKDDPNIVQARLGVSELHAGSKFDKTTFMEGTNGVGVSAVNALSEHFIVKTRVTESDASLSKIDYKDNLFYICEFNKGIFKSEEYKVDDKEKFNTIVAFKPDLTIMESDEASLPENLGYSIYICEKINKKKLSITINGKPYEGKVKDLTYNFDKEIRSNDNDTDYVRFLMSFSFLDDFSPAIISGSVNGLTCDQGIHISNISKAFTDAFNMIFRRKFGSDAVMRGMQFRIIALANEPNFASQTKERLANIRGFSKRTTIISDTLTEEFRKVIKKNMPEFKEHLDKVVEFTNSIDKIGRKELIESKIATMSSSRPDVYLPYKLSDCSTTNRKNAELFLVEGDSAKAPLVASRDPSIHAIMALRGKVKNAVNIEIEQALENKEICDILNCIGIGTTDVHDPKKLRYGKIIIATDRDSDGFQISALLLGDLFKHCEVLFDLGVVYIAESPFYIIKKGKTREYYFADEYDKVKGKGFERIKGLGQLNRDDVKWSFFSENRRLTKITKDNYDTAIALLTSAKAKREIMEKNNVIDPHILGKRGESAIYEDNTDYEALFYEYDNNPDIQELLLEYSKLSSEEDRDEFMQKIKKLDPSVLIYLNIRG